MQTKLLRVFTPKGETTSTMMTPTSPSPALTTTTTTTATTSSSVSNGDDELRRRTEAVVFQRHGAVLGKRTIIKSEHYTNAINNPTQRSLYRRGIPNFRQIGDVPLAALAQPTLNGIKALLSWFGAKDRVDDGNDGSDGKSRNSGTGLERVTWINLREEPVIIPWIMHHIDVNSVTHVWCDGN